MFVCDEKVFFYKEEEGTDVLNKKMVLNRIDFSTKRIEAVLSDKIQFEMESGFYTVYNDEIYIPYGKDIIAITPDKLKYKVIKMPESENQLEELKRVKLDTTGYQFVSAGFICNNQ